MKYDPEIHHRRSIRLKGYDYSQAGGYFVTIVTWQREYLFGEIVDGEMRLNAFGELVRAEWERTADICREVKLGAFVVMPNQLHAIVIFTTDGVATVGADGRPPLHRAPRSIGSLIAGFKSTVTKQINEIRGTPKFPVWQRDYYEQILRSADEANRIHLYIESNPSNWAEDEENR